MAARTQQFCLRWNNHQASLASSLPALLDSARFADVTLSAGGRTMRAHRVLLASCSEFFSDLFSTLGSGVQPVVVIPGVPFSSLCALITFVYSGEVTIFEDQLLPILSLADTLGIKGLANQQATYLKQERTDCAMDYSSNERTADRLIDQGCNTQVKFSPDFLPYDDPSKLFQRAELMETNNNNNNGNIRNNVLSANNTFCSDVQPPLAHNNKSEELDVIKREFDAVDSKNTKEPRKIDIIAELLKCGAGKRETVTQPQNESQAQGKVYATCFICQKRLSNQYNLRVHLDTHRDAQYACHVCRHVSRSRDALRKHVSYRHPGGARLAQTGGRRGGRKTPTTPAATDVAGETPTHIAQD